MNVKTLAQSALATIIAAHPELVIVLIANGKTANALRDLTNYTQDLTQAGETGPTTCIARCNADTIGTLTKGQTITAGGQDCTVLDAILDQVGAVIEIHYQLQRPISGAPDVS